MNKRVDSGRLPVEKGPPHDQEHVATKHVIFPLLFPFAFTTACTTVQDVIIIIITVYNAATAGQSGYT